MLPLPRLFFLSFLSLLLLSIASVGIHSDTSRNLRRFPSVSDLSGAKLHLASTIDVTFSTPNGTISGAINSPSDSFRYEISYDKCKKILLVFETLETNSAEMKISESSLVGSGSYLFTWSSISILYDQSVVCTHYT